MRVLPFRMLALLGSCSFALLLASTAIAWNSPGHMIVALIAYDQMDEATRVKAVALIRNHPRFHDHFERAMPKDISRLGKREQDEWLFAYAATWPDQVREAKYGVDRNDVKKFSRPWWHFVDFPVYLSENERPQLEHHLGVNLRRDPPNDGDDENMNIIQAVKNSAHIVRNAAASKEDRAVHLCWVLHLTGDAHQPLHSCALYTTQRFPGGDHGGNYLEIEHGWKLHGFWDDQIATEESFKTLRLLATNLDRNRKLADQGKKAAATLEVDKWIDESYEIAKHSTYSPEVLQKVAARESHSHLGPLDLSANYKAEAEAIAERRAIEAGYRLGAAVQKMLQ
jgi:hypothetical protein